MLQCNINSAEHNLRGVYLIENETAPAIRSGLLAGSLNSRGAKRGTNMSLPAGW